MRIIDGARGHRTRPRRRCTCDRLGVARLLTLLCVASATGCPQLLEDRFGTLEPSATMDAGRDIPLPSDAPPRVVASSPAAGARGVLPDTPIELTFSEPMDRAATEGAFASASIPRAGARLSWRDGDTVLVIQPSAPLPHAIAGAPNVTPLETRLALSSAALDSSGQPLAPFALSFSVASRITQSFEALRDRNLTGSWRSDGTYGIEVCERTDTTVCAGDSLDTDEPTYRGFITFGLNALPADHVAIESAELRLTLSLLAGTPFAGLGALLLEQLSFDQIGTPAFDARPDASLGTLAASAAQGETLRHDVTASVRAAAETGRNGQFRLRFQRDTDLLESVTVDLIVSDWATQHLSVTYWMP